MINLFRSPAFKRTALSFALGSLAALSMAPASFWPVLFVSLSGLYWLLSQAQGRRSAFALSWAFGFGYFLFGLSWIGSALLVEGNGYKWAYPLAISGIPFGLAFFWGFAGLLSYVVGRYNKSIGFISFILIFTVFETLRSYAFTGFPWNLMGYTWVNIPQITQFVAYASIFGLTGLTLFWMSVPGFWLSSATRTSKIMLSVVALASFAAVFILGAQRLKQADDYIPPPVNIKIVPGDIAQSAKWKRELMMDHLQLYLRDSMPQSHDEAQLPTLIVWPETAIVDWYYKEPSLLSAITSMLQTYDHAVLLTGALRQDENGTYNSLLMIDANGTVSNIYDKSHLVPFGEYIPFQHLIPLDPVNNFSGFVAGNGPEIFETSLGASYAPAICYEVIFPYALLPKAKKQPTFIVNVTNDAWYEGSAGPAQHYVQVLFRAIEYGIPIIRVANKGISNTINPYGQTLKSAVMK